MVAFEALTLERLYGPTPGKSQAEVLLGTPPPDLGEYRDDVPGALVSLLFTMLAKSPEDRPATAAEVVRSIDDILNELGPEYSGIDVGAYIQTHFTELIEDNQQRVKSAVAMAENAASKSSRSRWITIAAACAVLLLAGGLFGLKRGSEHPTTEIPAVASNSGSRGASRQCAGVARPGRAYC